MGHRIDIFRHTTAVINLDHLENNYRVLKSIVGDQVFFCPMVKANAYGHGDVEIALKLEQLGVQSLGLGLVEEALLLRQMGVKCDLLVFGIFDAKAVEHIIKWRLTPVISLWQQLEALEKSPFLRDGQKIPIHLKFDTGMHRLGFAVADAKKLLERLQNHSQIILQGVCTHLFKGDDAEDLHGQSFSQLAQFQEVERVFASMSAAGPIVSHALNSAGLLNFHLLRMAQKTLPHHVAPHQGVRPGLLIYGVDPMNSSSLAQALKPVMSLRSHIVRYRRLRPNETVSYGATWKAVRNSVIGVIPIGYADGYHRLLSNRAEVLVKGQRAPQVGNVCMDYIMVDVTGLMTDEEINNNIEVEVTLFGSDSQGNTLSVHELSSKAQTIPWEILTSVGERVPRTVESSHQMNATKKRDKMRREFE